MKDKPLGEDSLRALDALGAKGPLKVPDLSRYVTSYQWDEMRFARCDTTFEVREVGHVAEPAASRKQPFDCPVQVEQVDVWAEEAATLEQRSAHVLVCDDCGGEGKVNCDVCRGTAELTCPDCKGSGKVLKYYKTVPPKEVNCKKCRTKGKVKCPNCAKGLVTCLTCDGKTRLDARLTIRSSTRTERQLYLSDPRLKQAFPVLNETSEPREIAAVDRFDVALNASVEGDDPVDASGLPEDVARWLTETQKRRSEEARAQNWRVRTTQAIAGSYTQAWIKFKLGKEETRAAFVPKTGQLYPPEKNLLRQRATRVNGATAGAAAFLALVWLVYTLRDPVFANGLALGMGALLAVLVVLLRRFLKALTLRDLGGDGRRNRLLYYGYGMGACVVLPLLLGVLNVPPYGKLDRLLARSDGAGVAEMAAYLSKEADTPEEVDRLTGFFLKAASLTPRAADRLPLLQKLPDGTSHQAEKEEAIASAALELARDAVAKRDYAGARKLLGVIPEGKRQLPEVGALELEMTFEEGMALYAKRRCDEAEGKLKPVEVDDRYSVRVRDALSHCGDIEVLARAGAVLKERKYLEATNLAETISANSRERPAAEALQARCRAHLELARSVPELRFLDK